MGLKDLASKDAARYLGDLKGFAVEITITDPSGTSAVVAGFYKDVGITLDADTRMPILGRVVAATFHVDNIKAAGLEIPVGIQRQNVNHWFFEVNNPLDNAVVKYRIRETAPDRGFGIITVLGELTEEGD